jgi:hypothetical protein
MARDDLNQLPIMADVPSLDRLRAHLLQLLQTRAGLQRLNRAYGMYEDHNESLGSPKRHPRRNICSALGTTPGLNFVYVHINRFGVTQAKSGAARSSIYVTRILPPAATYQSAHQLSFTISICGK